MFRSKKKLSITSGNGGNGSGATYLSLHQRRAMKPYGGNGGWGGHIDLQGCDNFDNLSHLKNSYIAGNGCCGGKNGADGAYGSTITLQVPLTTACYDTDHGLLMTCIDSDNRYFRVAQGGAGGLGNLQTSSERKRVGQSGKKHNIELVHYWWVDIAILGSYNLGKSTLFNLLMGKNIATVGCYPYTTKSPLKGAVHTKDLCYIKQILDTPPIEKFADCCCYRETKGLIVYLVSNQVQYDYLIGLVKKRLIKPSQVWLVSTNPGFDVEKPLEMIFNRRSNVQDLKDLAHSINMFLQLNQT